MALSRKESKSYNDLLYHNIMREKRKGKDISYAEDFLKEYNRRHKKMVVKRRKDGVKQKYYVRR